jgi:hypothetical protein
LVLRQRDDLALQVATADGVIHLQALKASQLLFVRDPQRAHDLPRLQIAKADVTDFARAHTIIEGFERFLQRRMRIVAMDLVEIDVRSAWPVMISDWPE